MCEIVNVKTGNVVGVFEDILYARNLMERMEKRIVGSKYCIRLLP